MEEKILIKSNLYNIKMIRNICIILSVVVFILFVGIEIIDDMSHYNENRQEYEMGEWYGDDEFFEKYPNAFHYATHDIFTDSVTFTLVIGYPMFKALVPLAFGLIFYMWVSKMEMIISDKRVYGVAAFGKRVDLPLDSISAVRISIFKGIAVATSSGRIVFHGIKNRDEIHEVLSALLIERQKKEKTVTQTTIKQEIPQSNADELKKFKDLLDSGIITQEEFDAKKKQLLGL